MPTAALYLRVSLDSTGEGMAVDRQREDCRRLAEQRGWTIADEFVDNSVSAAGATTRPAFTRLIETIESGALTAVVAWQLDRLARTARDRLRLIDACREHGVVIALVRGSDLDPTTAAGRMVIGILGEVAQMEIEMKGERQTRAYLQAAQHGRVPRGRRALGYDDEGRIVDHEAALVREMFVTFRGGGSLSGIARTLQERGVPTRRGGRWTAHTVRTILKNPRYAGRRAYRGEVLEGVVGEWEPIVDGATFDVVNARLADPRRRTQHGTDRKHLGSGLYVCGECGDVMRGWSGHNYRCKTCGVSRKRDVVDAYVVEVLRARLRRPDLCDLVVPDGVDVAPLVARASALRGRIAAVEADYDAGLIDGVRLRSALERARGELALVDADLARAQGAGAEMVLAAPDPAAAFDDAPLMIRRSVLDRLCVVRLRRGVHGGSGWRFDPESVVVEWREPSG